MEAIGCGDNSCIVQRPSGMATNGGCRCPVVGENRFHISPDLPPFKVPLEDVQRLRKAFMELNKEIKRLKAEALVRDSQHKQKVTRMETSLLNIITNCKNGPMSPVDEVNVEVAVRGLTEPLGIEALIGAFKDEDFGDESGTSSKGDKKV